VADPGEIRQIEFGKQGLAVPQVRIMCAEAPFEKLTALGNRFEPLTCGVAVAIISPQIAERLFTLKDRCGSNSLLRESIRRDIGTISALWKTHFHCARGIPLRLRPKKC
jgi:hypothetical protein